MHRYCDVKRNPDSYELLCWNCHREFDRKGGYNVFFGLLLVEWLNGGGLEMQKGQKSTVSKPKLEHPFVPHPKHDRCAICDRAADIHSRSSKPKRGKAMRNEPCTD